VGAERVRLEFRKVITASNELSGETKERLLRFLSAPFDWFEKDVRARFGLVSSDHEGEVPKVIQWPGGRNCWVP
jgi:hypothetical protein